jgi:hypothetical protein
LELLDIHEAHISHKAAESVESGLALAAAPTAELALLAWLVLAGSTD